MNAETLKVSDCLIEAKADIGTPEKWFCGWHNRTEKSRCTRLAIHYVKGVTKFAEDRAVEIFKVANSIHEPMSLAAWNDNPSRTHSEVMEAFDKAIALALSEESK